MIEISNTQWLKKVLFFIYKGKKLKSCNVSGPVSISKRKFNKKNPLEVKGETKAVRRKLCRILIWSFVVTEPPFFIFAKFSSIGLKRFFLCCKIPPLLNLHYQVGRLLIEAGTSYCHGSFGLQYLSSHSYSQTARICHRLVRLGEIISRDH